MTAKIKQIGLNTVLFCMLISLVAQSLYAESVLSRLRTENDPELGECLRLAIKDIPIPAEFKTYNPTQPSYKAAKRNYNKKRVALVRAVTESYSQIRLLDFQIDQIDNRVKKSTGRNIPSTLHNELILARTELESKRIQELARLREIMGIIPRHAFGQIGVEELSTWAVLDVLDDEHVIVYDMKKPFTESIPYQKYGFVKDVPCDKAVAHIRDLLQETANRPFRIDIFSRKNSVPLSEKMHTQLGEIVQRQSLEMNSDIRLANGIKKGVAAGFYCIQQRVGDSYKEITTNTKRKKYCLLTDILDNEGFKNKIMRLLRPSRPGILPLTIVLEHDKISLENAKQLARTIKSLAEEHRLSNLVTVSLEPTTRNWPIPEEENNEE